MKTIEYRTQLPDEFPDGEWKNEYDKKQFLDKRTGLPCLVVRSPAGALCGYVGVNKAHPFFSKNYDDVAEVVDIKVHWGLTFSDECAKMPTDIEEVRSDYREKVREHGPYAFFVCHKVETGEDDNVWWFGFDCAHYLDVMPSMLDVYKRIGVEPPSGSGAAYRNTQYVEREVRSLALQLKNYELVLKRQSKRRLYRKMRFPYAKSAA